MQISTNWSVSHLRHWRPPVASSGNYLYRHTGRSWFKSKQSALRSILPNANIHHNERCPGRGQGQRLLASIFMSALCPAEEDRSNVSALLGLLVVSWLMKHPRPNWTEDISRDMWVYNVTVRVTGSIFLHKTRKRDLKQIQELKSQTFVLCEALSHWKGCLVLDTKW